MDKHQIEHLVDEEIARRRVAEALDPPKNNGIWEFLKHPFLLTLLGFVLTGIIGTLFVEALEETKRTEARELEERDRDRSRREAAIEEVKDMLTRLEALRLKFGRARLAVTDSADLQDSERRDRVKLAYDAYIAAHDDWGVAQKARSLTIQGYFGTDEWTIFNGVLSGVVDKQLGWAHICLGDAVARLEGLPQGARFDTPEQAINDCDALTRDKQMTVSVCSTALGRVLVSALRSDQSPGDAGWKALIVAASVTLEKECSLPAGALGRHE